MNPTTSVRLSKSAAHDGHLPCECGEFTHVFSASVVRQLPKGYSGEMCKRCNLWMCSTEKIGQREARQ